jgi:hypothetical protein
METPLKLAVSRETLEAAPVRAVRLLRGIGGSLVIRSLLLPFGFTKADLAEGWALLHDACGIVDVEDEEPSLTEAADAVRELDAWDERGFMLVRASVTHRFPPQALFLLAGLEAQEGPEAVAGVATLLDRLDALESDPRRQETRDDDHATLDLLAKRGLGPEQRAHLQRLVAIVRRTAGTPDTSTRTEEGNQLARLSRLRGWFDEWAEICRVVLRRPEHLIKVGLAGSRASV